MPAIDSKVKGFLSTDAEVPSKLSINENDADQALKFVRGQVFELDTETNKRVLRKIDWHLLPLMCTLYLLQYLDKTALSYAAIMGLKTDTNLNTYQYGWIGSIFYAGYLIFEYPHNFLLQKLPATKYLSTCIILWGLVLCCMAACKNYPSLMVVRAFLGALEGSVTPGFVLITARWYRADEQTNRIGIWFSFNGVSAIVGGAVAYGIAQGLENNPRITYPGWKIIFILCGLLTSCFGAGLWFMPNTILDAKWLTEEEKLAAIERIRSNQQGLGNRKFKKDQFKEALTDIRTWLYFLFTLACEIPSGGITVFFTLLISGYGFSTTETLLISMPSGLVQLTTTFIFCWLAHKLHNRALVAALSMLLSIFGPSLMVGLATPSNPLRARIGQLVGYYITIGNSSPAFIIILGMIATNCAGYTKKVTVNALNLIAYCVGFLVGPQIFRDGPTYRKAKLGVIGCWIVSFLCCLALYLVNRRENQRRGLKATVEGVEVLPDSEFLDRTDMQNQNFRYAV
ncbi:MAG: hypothetical protein M1834_007267 [Cirrosporium novae-zelandiae]|nr:MAG: hypothetical protein M1834_007267 [Cirrosporium novae-zelandiae]